MSLVSQNELSSQLDIPMRSTLPCLINQSACGQVDDSPVCPKCGMDERVVYPGQADREAAQASALARYEASQEAVKPPPPHEPAKPPTAPEPLRHSPKLPEPERPTTAEPEKKGIKRLGVAVLILVLLGGSGWWWKNQREHEVAVEASLNAYHERLAAEQAAASLHDRYQISANGSEVKDVQSGQIWARCSVGQHWDGSRCAGEAREFSFDEAQKLARNGWRVPTVRELASLVFCSFGRTREKEDPKDGGMPIASICVGEYIRPTIWQEAFPNTPKSWYWTSSHFVGNSNVAWVVGYTDGGIGNYYRNGDAKDKGHVRLVRANQ